MFERLRAQSGAFLMSAFHERFEREEVLKQTKDVPIYAYHTLTVPHTRKGRHPSGPESPKRNASGSYAECRCVGERRYPEVP